MDKEKRKKAFSLIEVLIFTSLLSIFFVIAASVTVASLRNLKISEHKILATRYAEELLDWLRDQKDDDWESFLTKAGSHCFNDSPLPSAWTTTDCSQLLASFFSREAVLTVQGDQINVKVTVSWSELGNSYQLPLATVLRRWED